MQKQSIPLDQSVGMVLPHDITEITLAAENEKPYKGPAFKKGHIIRKEDLEHLRRLGKEHIYVLSLDRDEIHENEAARFLADSLAGPGIIWSGRPSEGKLTMLAEYDGLLKVDSEALYRFNLLGEVMCATLHNNTPVKKRAQVGATRLIPLVGKRELVEKAGAAARESGGILKVNPVPETRAGLVITGNEVYYGRVKDKFEPVLRKKLGELNSTVMVTRFARDDEEAIAGEIKNCIESGADIIVTSGGMSVDPDDRTRAGISRTGAVDIVYGTPVLPGAMFLVARIGKVPILGLPACGMFHGTTVFDLILPRILTGEKIS
ncbi:MAG: molybdopterin-binding protein, partial [Thermodesulfobacteriota bacterium]